MKVDEPMIDTSVSVTDTSTYSTWMPALHRLRSGTGMIDLPHVGVHVLGTRSIVFGLSDVPPALSAWQTTTSEEARASGDCKKG